MVILQDASQFLTLIISGHELQPIARTNKLLKRSLFFTTKQVRTPQNGLNRPKTRTLKKKGEQQNQNKRT